ncbi:uncharacterized protein LTR77_004088 [Saxophila tyrrhenica]|uniref:protein-histidine N-methyltransferase n=1 Tax=Saxophila tyrrhenica TaxID=1690608 RepID=A0AAV9PBM7_9PEZI|nr:hypothetical protein LTR77_004088 [Saxophila tyrrhenica]
MAFRFGFGDEDGAQPAAAAGDGEVPPTPLRPVHEHPLQELLDTLPDQLSYSTVQIESPTGRTIHLPRRELYDIRLQLLSEDETNDEVVDQLDNSDLRSGIYEGGFKTWECSLDLASLLLDRGPRKDIDDLMRCDQVVELGAGTAMPSLVLFQHALLNSIPMTFVFADYNDAVLRLATLPNMLLTWALNTTPDGPTSDNMHVSSKGDLGLNEDILKRFKDDMKARNINFIFLSGPWSPDLASHIPNSSPDLGTVILAAETIYSPASTTAFVELVVTLLKRVKMAKVMIGAKRMYFGVGGSVDGLKEACRERGAVAYEIENHGVPGMDGGVGRALVEVQMY